MRLTLQEDGAGNQGLEDEGDGTVLTLDLPEHGSVFVVFRKQSMRAAAPFRTASDRRPPASVELSGPWEVSFQAGRGSGEEGRLRDAGRLDGAGRPRHQVFPRDSHLPQEPRRDGEARRGGPRQAQLGSWPRSRRCGSTARTSAWYGRLSPAVELTRTTSGKNELEIEVTGAWADRLVGDAGRTPGTTRYGEQHAVPKERRALKAFQGFASEDALQPSGLVGPVHRVVAVT